MFYSQQKDIFLPHACGLSSCFSIQFLHDHVKMSNEWHITITCVTEWFVFYVDIFNHIVSMCFHQFPIYSNYIYIYIYIIYRFKSYRLQFVAFRKNCPSIPCDSAIFTKWNVIFSMWFQFFIKFLFGIPAITYLCTN